MQRFRKLPVVVEAMVWDNADSTLTALKRAGCSCYAEDGQGWLRISTLEGTMEAHPGDYIVKGVKGEFYPCKPDIFAATYQPEASAAPVEGVDLEEVLRLDREGTPGPLYVEGKNLLCEQNGRILAEFRYGTDGARLANVLLAAVFRTAAPALARALMAERAHVRRLEAQERRLMAEAEELRLTLAAEQGRAEGAPSAGWEFDGRDWNKNYTDGSFAGLSGRRGKRCWMRAQWPDTERAPHYLGRGHDVETDRAAMLAADAADAAVKP